MKKRITMEDMKLLAEIIEDLNRIKIYGIKAEAYNKGLQYNEPDKLRVEIPSPEEFLKRRRKPDRLEELHDMIKGYIGTIKGAEILDDIEYEAAKTCVHGRIFYNEIPPYQAKPFIHALYDVLNHYVQGKYYVEPYDVPEVVVSFGKQRTGQKFY